MKAVVLAACFASLASAQPNPLGTVISLLDELTAKITKDGENEAKAYAEYVEWCDDTSKNSGFAIDTATKEKAQLEAKIQELTSNMEAASTKIDGLASDIATGESELKDATLIRGKEKADFAASEKELVEAIDALNRAVAILQREMAKNPAAFAQVDPKDLGGALQAFGAVLDAAALSSSDQKQLAALVQSQQTDEADDELGSPAAAAYKTHSGNILDVLEDLKEKAEGQLSDLRKAEVNTKHNFNLLKQSLEDQMAADTKDMNEETAGRAAAAEVKASSQSDLEMTAKELANSKAQLSACQTTCVKVAADHDATVAARTQELKVIAEARKVLSDSTSGAVAQTYSFIQRGSSEGASFLLSQADLAGREVIELVRRLAKKEHSSALNQLASRISAVARYSGSNREDVFAKVKGLIQAMIAKLEQEAGSEATEKAYCDEQIAKTEAKKGELEEDVAKMTSRIDQAAAKSARLKGQVKELEDELAALARTQAQMDQIRSETHADYTVAKADLESGLTGVRQALSTLRDYYGSAASMVQEEVRQPAAPEVHSKSAGAGGSIIDILEVVESDFALNLAKEEAEEADAH